MRKLSVILAAVFILLPFCTRAELPRTTKKEVHIPCYNGGFTFGLAGYYLRPSTPHLDFAVIFPETNALNDFGLATFKSNDPKFDWGYSASVGYIFPCSANDIRLTYTRLNTDETNHFFRNNDQAVINIQGGDFDDVSDTHLDAKTKFDYQSFDFDLGQYMSVGCVFELHYYGGVRYADLDQDFDVRFIERESPFLEGRLIEIRSHQSSRYQGIGPHFGAEGNYDLGCGFGLKGQLNTSLLIGEMDTKFREEEDFTLQTLILESDNALHYPDQTRVVPNLDGRLSVDYSFRFCNASRSKFSLEAGYQVIHYFNTIDRIAAPQLDKSERRIQRQVIDTSFDGPFIGIQVVV